MALLSVANDLDESFSVECQSIESLEKCKSILSASKHNIKVLTYNIRSYNKNFDEFTIALKRLDSNIDFIVLTECWLSAGIIIEDLPGYCAYKTTTQVNKNGGIVIYARSDWSMSIVMTESRVDDADSILIQINNDFSLLAIYRSPSFTNTDKFLNSLDTTLLHLKNKQNIIVAGDMNINISDISNNQTVNYMCLMASHSLLPAITTPTRYDTCIDHIFIKTKTTPFGLVCNSTITDHDIALCSFPRKSQHYSNIKRCKTRTDWDAVAAELNQTNWDSVTNSQCVNTALNNFNNIITNALSNHTQQIKISRRKATLKPWITPGLLRCIIHRDKLHFDSRANPGNQTKRLIYTRYRNFLTNLLQKLRTQYNSAEIERTKGNPKMLWTTIRDICGNSGAKNSAISLIASKDPVSSLDKCNQHFVTVGEKLSAKILNRLGTTQDRLVESYTTSRSVANSFCLLSTDVQEVTNAIYSMNQYSAPGPDQVPVALLIKCRDTIVDPLTHIYNLSLESGIFPGKWKIAAVSPIFKNGTKDKPENYRPIALLSIISKILEKIVSNRLVNFLDTHNVISNRQFGFQRGKSTEDAVSLLTNKIAQNIENGKCTIGVFLDLAKAFDTVSPRLLLKKLEFAGVRGTPLKWFESYLTSRSQYIKVENHRSGLLPIDFGVPQGSILGPTLFSLYINDIVNIQLKNAEVISYADDTVVLFHDKSWDDVCRLAQVELSNLAKALNLNLLTLNVDKSKFIAFSKTKASCPPRTLSLKIHHCSQINNCTCEALARTDCIKYLGINVDCNLTYADHIFSMSSRVRKLIHVMKKLRNCCSINILRNIYYGLCQSILQYCIIIWGGATKSLFITLERAQRAVIKVALRRPYMYPTDLVYQDFQVLRVRQLYLLRATLKMYSTLANRSDYQDILRKRVFRIPLPPFTSELARRCTTYTVPNIYNKVTKICSPGDCLLKDLKIKLTQFLMTLSYLETESLL